MVGVDMLVVGHLEDGHHRTLPVRGPWSFAYLLLECQADEMPDQNHHHGGTDAVLVLNCIEVPQPEKTFLKHRLTGVKSGTNFEN